ncbi:hypothetical protein Nepgr_016886 [Nepenthes gracilis]|uniref:Uncharacterized protein n=1 Tax=Nepenthes gracilis TaxID=150966 RepID=A0AAD3XSW7_NEPGR|nr:hypothetical protein Nepgr_016886 [Nepenthes gracilis]
MGRDSYLREFNLCMNLVCFCPKLHPSLQTAEVGLKSQPAWIWAKLHVYFRGSECTFLISCVVMLSGIRRAQKTLENMEMVQVAGIMELEERCCSSGGLLQLHLMIESSLYCLEILYFASSDHSIWFDQTMSTSCGFRHLMWQLSKQCVYSDGQDGIKVPTYDLHHGRRAHIRYAQLSPSNLFANSASDKYASQFPPNSKTELLSMPYRK